MEALKRFLQQALSMLVPSSTPAATQFPKIDEEVFDRAQARAPGLDSRWNAF